MKNKIVDAYPVAMCFLSDPKIMNRRLGVWSYMSGASRNFEMWEQSPPRQFPKNVGAWSVKMGTWIPSCCYNVLMKDLFVK